MKRSMAKCSAVILTSCAVACAFTSTSPPLQQLNPPNHVEESSRLSFGDDNLKTSRGIRSPHRRMKFSGCNSPIENIPACPSTDEDDSIDSRREALFALAGATWATLNPLPASALYGSDAKMELPDVMDSLSARATGRQCLVESLGNRECLAYLDPEAKLYKKPDATILIGRILSSSEALSGVPTLVGAKKWSQVLGVTTGPMGTLTLTMNALVKDLATDEDRNSKREDLAKLVKGDIIAIGQGAERKNGDDVLKACDAATDHLAKFIQLL